MSISLNAFNYLLKSMKIKKSYDQPLEVIESRKKQNNRKKSFSFRLLKGQTIQMRHVCNREVAIIRSGQQSHRKALLYLYGGGFSSEISNLEKRSSVQFGKRSGRDLWIPRYPNVMDEGITIRELYKMILETYRVMLESYLPEDIAVIGFSAGATLGIGMFEYNQTLAEPLPVPHVLIAGSPACIPATEEERQKVLQLDELDLMIPASFTESIKAAICHGEELPSWMYEITTGNLSDMPLTHVYYGSNEVLLASCESLKNAYLSYGSEIKVHIGQGLFHCYPAIDFIPECRQAFNEIVDILKQS